MFDIVVPSLATEIKRMASSIQEFNTRLHDFYPLNRREELLEYDRDLRIRQTTAWRFIHDWVLDGLDVFISHSLRLLDVMESRKTSQETLDEITEGVYEQAVVAGDRCLCGRNRIRPIGGIYGQLGGVLQRYAAHPIPQVFLENQTLLGYLAQVVTGPEQHTSAGAFKRLISVNDQIRISSDQISTALGELAEFFEKLTDQFKREEMDASWAAKMDIKDLRERWSRLQEEIAAGKTAMTESINIVCKLEHPLYS
ncbi:hypothetical protein FRB95_010959 [Tulasnella sp. JGI-2019a]|nr:hypothetical protein FRB95_010959 [Tulasnella sp. JGI-2019a]